MLSWIPAAYLLSTVIFLLPAGILGDIYGRGTIFTWGTVTYIFASFFTIFSPSAEFLLGCRILQGIGGAMIYATAVAIIAEVFPPGERGKALGINVTAIYAGLTLGPFLGGLLVQFFGWRSIFVVTILLGLPALLFVPRFPPHLNYKKRQSFDIVGSILLALVLSCFFIGISLIASPVGITAVLFAAGLFAIFYRFEERKTDPLFPIALFRSNRLFTLSSLAALINYSTTFAVTFLMSLYLQVVRGYGPAEAGTILLVQPFMQMVCAPIAGRLSDRMDPSLLASVGLSISAISLLGLAFLNAGTPLVLIIGTLALLGTGLGLFSAPNTNVMMCCVDKRDYSVASAIVATMRSLGMILSMGVVMVVFALLIGDAAITSAISEEFLGSMQVIFLAFFGLTILGVAVSRNRRVAA